MADTRFYRTQDDVLARARRGGFAVPEVFGHKTKKWRPYPELDTLHDARPIERAEAAKLAGDADLDGD